MESVDVPRLLPHDPTRNAGLLNESKNEHDSDMSPNCSEEQNMVQPGLGVPRRSRRAEKRQSVKHTELCAFFVEGKCTRGNRCTFAHGVDQLRPRPDLFKTRLCQSYQMFMRCPYGESCTHAHGLDDLRLPVGASDLPDGFEVGY
eukprot:symbB.v1.2.039544.t2/scaffold6637.1/size16560/1